MKDTSVTETSFFPAILLAPIIIVQLIYFNLFGGASMSLSTYLIVSALLLLIIVSFYKLTVTVKPDRIVMKFGIGLLKITKRIDKLKEVELIDTSLWWGIGIRLTPKGMLFNVNSSDAVHVKYERNGTQKGFMIGLSERKKLKGIMEDVLS